ncbi:MAG: hypothetical protein MPK75_03890 [Alphaproteobacteria bacterium]|nr:hypothetical protein [Alphaproteobacteria bacterium]
MSESSEHRNLVKLIALDLQERYPNAVIKADLQMKPGDPVPRIVNNYRPDVYAHDKAENFCIIGEAKASGLGSKHTHAQITSFILHLEEKRSGVFILGAFGAKSNEAKTLLRFVRRELGLVNTSLQVFDGCDYWTLDSQGGKLWHLS